jgi:predicted transcriptional regulator
MSPLKLSLINPDNDDPDVTVDLDDELAGKLQQVVDSDPDLTMGEALRQGIAHVAERGPKTKS